MSKLNSAVTAAMMATMSMAPGGTTGARTYRNDTNGGNGGSIAVAARRGPINTTAMLRGRKRAERRARQRARR